MIKKKADNKIDLETDVVNFSLEKKDGLYNTYHELFSGK